MTNGEEAKMERAPSQAAIELANGGLAEELAAAAPRRRWNRITLVLAAVLLLAGGFLAGAHIQREYGPADTGSSASRAGPFAGGNGPAGQFPGSRGSADQGASPGPTATGAGAADTTGTVKLVNGRTIYLQTEDGTVLTVRTDDSTSVRLDRATALTAVKAGDTVTVRGARDGEGVVTATTVRVTER